MGLDTNGLRTLLYAKQILGCSLDSLITLGRQELHISPQNLRRVCSEFGLSITDAEISSVFKEEKGYAESLLKKVGAQYVYSCDASEYEGATHVNDFNNPIPESWRNQFSCMFDLGSLEHIFNFPQAIKNCMDMVRVGGHFICMTPSNNLFGHGFYQFSPEVFSRVLSENYGFKTLKIFLFEYLDHPTWREIIEPNMMRHNFALCNSRPTYLAVFAQKTSDSNNLFITFPQQGNYSDHLWQAKSEIASPSNRTKKLGFLKGLVPRSWKGCYYSMRAIFFPYDKRVFRKANLTKNS